MNGFKKNIFERCLPHIHRRSGNNGRDYDARAEENRHRNQTAGWQNPYEDAADSAGKQVGQDSAYPRGCEFCGVFGLRYESAYVLRRDTGKVLSGRLSER